MPVEKKKNVIRTSSDIDEDEIKRSCNKISSSTKSSRKTSETGLKEDSRNLINSSRKNSESKILLDEPKHNAKDRESPITSLKSDFSSYDSSTCINIFIICLMNIFFI